MSQLSLWSRSEPFLNDLERWVDSLPVLSLPQAAPQPQQAAIVSVDVIKGFCTVGPLASPRVEKIVQPIATLFQAAWAYGIHHILLTQDTHEPDAVEFSAWPPHCVRGTEEAETVDAIKRLPFFDQMLVMPKNSIHAGMNTGLNDWMSAHPTVHMFFVVGDCTDLCTYQLAMHLRLDANARQLQRRVIVPVDCVDTYDRPLAAAQAEGGFAHPADLLHAIFLYHMALNGVEVVQHIEG
jgi:nicotinamidase-related amidase